MIDATTYDGTNSHCLDNKIMTLVTSSNTLKTIDWSVRLKLRLGLENAHHVSALGLDERW